MLFTKGKVLCFGELLIRFSPSLNGNWPGNQYMPSFIGGAELNVATALSVWDIPAKYYTSLPDNDLSRNIIASLEERKIDASAISLSGKRIGIYYLPQGADMKNAGVIYDREGSSFSALQTGTIDWDIVLADCSWFHFSAIDPALNDTAAAVCLEGVKAARSKGLTVSIDLNYRPKLWGEDRNPVPVMQGLLPYCDIVMGNIWSAHKLLGLPLPEPLHGESDRKLLQDQARTTALALLNAYPQCKVVANTFRFEAGEGIHYFATLDTITGQFRSPSFRSKAVKDKVGSGDCFMAGLIRGLYTGKSFQETIEFATSAAFGKLHEPGDTTQQSEAVILTRLSTQKANCL